MSYSFDGSNDRIAGTFTETFPLPITIAAFIQITAHSAPNADTIINFGNASAVNNSHQLQSATTEHRWQAESRDAGGTDSFALVTDVNLNGVWAGIVGKYTNDSLRDLYVQNIANTGQSTATRVVTGALDVIRIGENLNAANDFSGLIAEVAIWESGLSNADITLYLGGLRASLISPSTLIGYWPLSAAAGTQTNQGLGAGGNLTVTGATFSALHPTISSGSGKRRRTALLGVG